LPDQPYPTDLAAIAKRHGLTLDPRGVAIDCGPGPGRIVAWGDSERPEMPELAWTGERDERTQRLLDNGLTRLVYKTTKALTVAFPPGRLAKVLAVVGGVAA
jgi:hypothetical protein